MDRSHTLTSHILIPIMYQDTFITKKSNIAAKKSAIAAKEFDSPPRSSSRRQGVRLAAKEFKSPPRSSTHRKGGATAEEPPKGSCQGQGTSEGSPNCRGVAKLPRGRQTAEGLPNCRGVAELPNGREITWDLGGPGGAELLSHVISKLYT